MKKIILSVLTLFTFALSNAQGTENFNNATALPTGSIYGDGSFVGNGGVTWNYVHCQSALTYPIDGEGVLLRRSNEPSKITATFQGGIGNFSVDTRKGYEGNTQRKLELVINGEVVAQFQPAFANGLSDQVIPFVVNNINVTGTVNLELRMFGATGNQHLVLDNISWTGYTGNVTPEPNPACDIVVNLEFPDYGDVTVWRLLDGDGTAVLAGGPYIYDENDDFMMDFTITSDAVVGYNPPYSLEVSINDGESWYCDNIVNYTVTVGGVEDISGTMTPECWENTTETFDLVSDFTPCLPSCPSPKNLAVSNFTATSADLSWTGTATSYIIEWGVNGFTPGTGTVITDVQSPYTLVVPTIGGYQFYVKADCGSGDVSTYSAPRAFVVGGYNLGDIPTQSGTTSSVTINSTDYCTPEPTITVNVPVGYRIASLQVQYSMSAINGAYMSEQRSFIYSPTLSEGESQMFSGVGLSEGTFNYNRALTFANHQTGSIDFVLRAWRTWSTYGEEGCSTYNNYVNNGTWVITPTFEPIPQCLEPTGVNANNIAAYTAEFGWNAIDGAESYTWYVFENNANPATATPLFTGIVTTNSVEVTGLTPETNYDFYVVTNCGATNGDSPMSSKVDFLTLIACPSPTALTHTQLSLTSAELSFTSNGANFELKWGATGFDVNTAGTLVTLENETSIILESLTTNDVYQFYVRQDCTASNDGYSVWSGPYAFSVGYCEPTIPSFNDETGITQVSFGNGEDDDINSPSASNNVFYSDFTSISKEVEVGEIHNLSVRVNTAGNYVVQARAWIDWNNDGVFDTALFEDGGEAYLLGSANNVTDGLTSDSPKAITIPNLVPGQYRMRVKAVYGAAVIPNPCTAQNYSDTEDYTIIVVETVNPCEGTPTPTADLAQTLNIGQTVADIVVTGENLTWYSDADLTTEVAETTVLEVGTYTFYVAQTIGDCTSTAIAIEVTVVDPCAGTPAPTADSPQAMTVGQTVADIAVDGENLTWYSDEDLTTEVEETFVLEEGSYTFYVTQTIGECTSEAIEVVVEVSLSTGGFDVMSFKAYPNPVKDIFTISYSKNIADVTVVNMLGQIVAKQTVQSTDAQINMSALPAGNYVVKVAVDGAVQTLKVVKQ